MHQKGVCHRDLKPENVLLKHFDDVSRSRDDYRNFQVKIADVGSSKILVKEKAKNTPYVVSRYYRAPEVILGANHYTTSIDIWSAGCILFELLTTTPLFNGDEEGLQIYEFANILGPPAKEDVFYFSANCETDVKSIFAEIKTQNKSPVFRELLSINGRFSREEIDTATDLLIQCLKWDPRRRITAEKALEHEFFA